MTPNCQESVSIRCYYFHALALLLCVVMLAGCGGGGDDGCDAATVKEDAQNLQLVGGLGKDIVTDECKP